MWQLQQRFTFDSSQSDVLRFLDAATKAWRFYFLEATTGGTLSILLTDKPLGFRERTDPPPQVPPSDSNVDRRLFYLEWQHSVPSAAGRALQLCLFGPSIPGNNYPQAFVAELQLRQVKSRECVATLFVDTSPVWEETDQRIDVQCVAQVDDFLCGYWEKLLSLWDRDRERWLTDAQQMPPTVRADLANKPDGAAGRAPYTPKRPADLRRWRKCWHTIAAFVNLGMSDDEILGQLAKMENAWQPGNDTLRKIILAGDAHRLD